MGTLAFSTKNVGTSSADLAEAIQAFHSLRTRRLDLINEANIILLPKIDGAASINEFRPISLINSLAKIITKILSR
jgi:hypothetical protein